MLRLRDAGCRGWLASAVVDAHGVIRGLLVRRWDEYG